MFPNHCYPFNSLQSLLSLQKKKVYALFFQKKVYALCLYITHLNYY